MWLLGISTVVKKLKKKKSFLDNTKYIMWLHENNLNVGINWFH